MTAREQVHENRSEFINKLPQITTAFWLMKITATTLGETGGDCERRSCIGQRQQQQKEFHLSSYGLFVPEVTLSFWIDLRHPTDSSCNGPDPGAAVQPLPLLDCHYVTTIAGMPFDRSLGIGDPGGSVSLFTGCW